MTQYFSASSIYRMTPTTEDVARRVASVSSAEPVHAWQLPPPDRRQEVAIDDDDGDEAEKEF